MTSSEQQQSAELARLGGTSNVALVVVPIVLVFIIGILAAIAIPAYQDFTIRAQVSEGLYLAAGAKAAVTDYYKDHGAFPEDNETAGLSGPGALSGKFVTSVVVDDGSVVVTYGGNAHVILTDKTIVLSPAASSTGAVTWDCRSAEIQPRHLPAACR
jgi:type IV pilus assembly protein PilA